MEAGLTSSSCLKAPTGVEGILWEEGGVALRPTPVISPPPPPYLKAGGGGGSGGEVDDEGFRLQEVGSDPDDGVETW